MSSHNMPLSNNAISILLVDDERLILTAMSRELRQAGYNINTVESVHDAEIWLHKNNRPDLVVLDMRMPGGCGLELVPKLEALNHIPFILQTAYSERDIIEKANASGAMSYLVKPVMIAQLITAIETALSRANAFADMRKKEQELQGALNIDRTVSVAIGIVMDHYRVNYDQAKELLRKTARSKSIKMFDLASSIIGSRENLNLGVGDNVLLK
ncbi:MAG: response regulator [Desulfobaccales bacterium]|nr:response regulator [Methylotenera sp.]MDP3183014.1 response regulator [Desulfobaccales bacterium]